MAAFARRLGGLAPFALACRCGAPSAPRVTSRLHTSVSAAATGATTAQRRRTIIPGAEERKRQRLERRASPELELASRRGELKLPEDFGCGRSMPDEEFLANSGHRHVRSLCIHDQVFEHCFSKEFPIRKQFSAVFSGGEQVHRGNIISATAASERPASLMFNAEPGVLWTVAMMSPDARLDGKDGQVLHWLSGNLESPESLATAVDQVPYVGPLAAPGGGHHRLVLALYRQEGKADFTSVTGGDVATLAGRYIDNADMIAALRLQPKGLCFFQSCHDDSVEARFAALGRGMPQF